jgi:glycosyltransferase involved in cell wall biosynthesis
MREVYAKRWQERGHEVVWGFRSPNPGFQYETWNGASAYLLPSKSHDELRTIIDLATGQSGIIETVWKEEGPFDAIQVRNDLALGLRAAQFTRQRDVRFIYRLSYLKSEELCFGYNEGIHCYGVPDYIRGQLGKRVRRILLKESDLTLTISSAMTEYIHSQGIHGPIESLPMGADTSIRSDEIDAKPFKNHFDIKSNYLVYIGTMNPIRQLEFLLPVLKNIYERRPETMLVMVGGRSDEHRDRLKRAAKQHGVCDNVRFTGWVKKETLRRAVVGADIGLSIFPPNYVLRTNSPTKALEYMNLSTPVVGTQTPEQKEIIADTSAGHVIKFETKAFTDTILNLLRHPETRRQMGHRGRKFIENNRSYDILCKRAVALYETYI